MATFTDWLVQRDPATLLRLLEGAEYFDPAAYNPVFDGELEKLLARIRSDSLRQQVSGLHGFDWANYIVRSLQRAGFRGDDLQENLHSIVVKLLVSPGKLFRGWNPQKHGSLDRRFKRSVWNAIRNIAAKTKNRRKWMVSADPTVMAGQYAGRQPPSGLLDDFRHLVAQRLGPLAVAILDQRLSGEDTKELVGRAESGSPTSYSIKREVGEIKKLAQYFATRIANPAFLSMVDRALEAEAETVAKRQQARSRDIS